MKVGRGRLTIMRPSRFGITVLSAAAAIAAVLQPAPDARATDAAVFKPALKSVAQAPKGKAQTPNDPGYWNPKVAPSFGPCYPFGCDYKGPSYPFGPRYSSPAVPTGPAQVTPHHPSRRWVPGYWAQQWVPQYSTYQVWVPGHYAGTWWVPGHYAQQTAETGGSYHNVWIDGYWAE
jgi:hypothetical protein